MQAGDPALDCKIFCLATDSCDAMAMQELQALGWVSLVLSSELMRLINKFNLQPSLDSIWSTYAQQIMGLPDPTEGHANRRVPSHQHLVCSCTDTAFSNWLAPVAQHRAVQRPQLAIIGPVADVLVASDLGAVTNVGAPHRAPCSLVSNLGVAADATLPVLIFKLQKPDMVCHA